MRQNLNSRRETFSQALSKKHTRVDRATASKRNFLASIRLLRQFLSEFFRGPDPLLMKAKIIITPKKAVLDPQGKTVQSALEHMGYRDVTGVHIGKYIEIDLAPGTDRNVAHQAINEAAHKLLSNPIIEDYRLEIE
jgi:phosphoribosylformylglycinamidine synthase